MYYIENIKQLRLYKTQGARSENLAWGPVRYLLRHWMKAISAYRQITDLSITAIINSREKIYSFLDDIGLLVLILQK